MSKKRGYLDTMINEVFRGTGRQTGRGISNLVQREVANRIYDPNSKFRKAMGRFDITSTVKGSLKKAYGIIDLFVEEYSLERTLFQREVYISRDVRKIDMKLVHIERLVSSEEDEMELQGLLAFWKDVKDQLKIK